MQILEVDNCRTYLDRAHRIVQIYNEDSPFVERLNLRKPASTRIISIDGDGITDSGGILLDHHSNADYFRIMFAGFDKANRGKGYLKKALDYAEQQGLDIRFVELNLGEKHEIWAKVGFPYHATWGWTTVAAKHKDEPGLSYNNRFGATPTKETIKE